IYRVSGLVAMIDGEPPELLLEPVQTHKSGVLKVPVRQRHIPEGSQRTIPCVTPGVGGQERRQQYFLIVAPISHRISLCIHHIGVLPRFLGQPSRDVQTVLPELLEGSRGFGGAGTESCSYKDGRNIKVPIGPWGQGNILSSLD